MVRIIVAGEVPLKRTQELERSFTAARNPASCEAPLSTEFLNWSSLQNPKGAKRCGQHARETDS